MSSYQLKYYSVGIKTTETNVREIFAYNLKRLRKSKKMSQLEFANAVGKSFTFISDIENCKKWISPETLSVFATKLGVEPYQLFLPRDFSKPTNNVKLSRFAEEITESIELIKSRYLL